MEFKNLTRLVEEFEKVTGKKFTFKDSLGNKTNTSIEYGYTFYDTNLEDYGKLKQNVPLSMPDLKEFLERNGRDLRYISLVQRGILRHKNPHNDVNDYEYMVKKSYPLNTILADETTIADNLQNFYWSYIWSPANDSGFEYCPPAAWVSMNYNLNEKIKEYINGQNILPKEIIPYAENVRDFAELKKIKEQVFKNME